MEKFYQVALIANFPNIIWIFYFYDILRKVFSKFCFLQHELQSPEADIITAISQKWRTSGSFLIVLSIRSTNNSCDCSFELC